MSIVIPYNECHSNLTEAENKAALEKVAAIIKINQLRSVGMPDITKCTNARCAKKSECYRFTVEPSSYAQSYDIFAPDNNTLDNFSCDMFMEDRK